MQNDDFELSFRVKIRRHTTLGFCLVSLVLFSVRSSFFWNLIDKCV